MKLLLLRHGPAVDAAEAGGSDAARQLSAEGRRAVLEAAAALKRLGIRFDRIVSSPLPRAAETARLTAEGLGSRAKPRLDERLAPGALPAAWVAAIGKCPRDEAVLLVGHNPDMEGFLGWLTSADGSAKMALKKGSLAIVRIVVGSRKLAHPGCGRLDALWQAADLRRLQ